MKHPRAASLTLTVAALVLLLLILVLSKGWWDYLLAPLVVLMLVGSYELRRHARRQTYRDVRSRRAGPPRPAPLTAARDAGLGGAVGGDGT